MLTRKPQPQEVDAEQLSPSALLLRESLKTLNITGRELARRTGLTPDYVYRLLSGKNPFPAKRETIEKIAEIIGLEPVGFSEYRNLLRVLPESTRKLWKRLHQNGISKKELSNRLPDYSMNYIYQILRGHIPFPRDPRTIQQLAQAAGMSPWDFAEYPPLADICQGLMFPAREALTDRELSHLESLLAKLQAAQRKRVSDDYSADQNKLLQAWLERQFGDPASATTWPMLGDVPFPALSKYQPEVQALLRGMWKQDITVEELANRAGVKPEDVWVIVEGQIQLQSAELKERLREALNTHQQEKRGSHERHHPDRR